MRAYFDHEKLDVYQLELRFVAWVTPFLEEVRRVPGVKTAEVCDQLDRASLSMLFNTAEGNGKRQRPIRAKFFDDSRGSATECAACLDASVAKKACSESRVIEGKEMLVRIVSMLSKLISMFSSDETLREDVAEYRVSESDRKTEDENEDEDEKSR
jgi:four helix bundle protein